MIERILYRLQEKVINRLLSIVTEGQVAAERKFEIRRKLSEQDIRNLLDDIYFNNYELTRDVLGIGMGRRRGSLNKPKERAELDSLRASRENEISNAMRELYLQAEKILRDPHGAPDSELKKFVLHRVKSMQNVESLLTAKKYLAKQMTRKRSTLDGWLEQDDIHLERLASVVIKANQM